MDCKFKTVDTDPDKSTAIESRAEEGAVDEPTSTVNEELMNLEL